MSRELLIMEEIPGRWLDKINATMGSEFDIKTMGYDDSDKIIQELKTAEVIVGAPSLKMIQNPEINCPNLKFIQMAWAGTDIYTRGALDFPSDAITLANASGAYGMIISQYVIGQILSLMLNFKKYHNQQQEQIWQRQGPLKSLENARVLIYGAGDIGTYVAKRLTGFDAYTIGVCRNKDKKREYFDEICTLEESVDYLSTVDVVVGCIPNTEETTGFMSEERLKLMKKDSIIVNVGRGNFIDCMALNKLLEEEYLWGAALDVTDPEPLPKGHPLWTNPRCIITPHASGVAFNHSEKTEDLLCSIICNNLERYKNGEEILNRIY